MKLKERIYAKRHLFMPGHTLGAVIKQCNLYDVSKDEMEELIAKFKELNTDAIFKPGHSGLIPILARHHQKVFSPEEIQ